MTYNFEQRFPGDNCENRKASDLRGWSRLYIVFSAGLLDIMVAGLEPSRVMIQHVLKC